MSTTRVRHVMACARVHTSVRVRACVYKCACMCVCVCVCAFGSHRVDIVTQRTPLANIRAHTRRAQRVSTHQVIVVGRRFSIVGASGWRGVVRARIRDCGVVRAIRREYGIGHIAIHAACADSSQ